MTKEGDLFFPERDEYAKYLGMEIVEARPGYAMVRMPVTPKHLNGLYSTHGGAVFSVADFALGVASVAHGPATLSVNASISYFRAVGDGNLFAEAKELHCGYRLASYEVDVRHDDGTLVAKLNGTVYRKHSIPKE